MVHMHKGMAFRLHQVDDPWDRSVKPSPVKLADSHRELFHALSGLAVDVSQESALQLCDMTS